jgi:hypothetical protein
MSSLETAAETRLRLVVSSATLSDWTNQRDDDAAENTAITTAAIEMACSEVKAYLGSTVDSADAFAVNMAARMAVVRLSNWWNAALTEGGGNALSGVLRELEREAEARRQGKLPSVVTPDTLAAQDLDVRYPQSVWADGSRTTSLPSDDDNV